MEYVILGNGIAGVCAAETIRQFDAEGGVTMVADETLFPGMEHHEFSPENAYQKAEELVKAAVENFSRRNKNRVAIPAIQPQEVVSGLSVEAVIKALGGTPDPLIDAIEAGKIRGRWALSAVTTPKSSTTMAIRN